MSPNYFEESDTYSSGVVYELNELNELILEKFNGKQWLKKKTGQGSRSPHPIGGNTRALRDTRANYYNTF